MSTGGTIALLIVIFILALPFILMHEVIHGFFGIPKHIVDAINPINWFS